MSNFWQRTLTGIVFVIVMISSVLIDYFIFAGVIAVFVAVGLWEFYSLAEKKNVVPLKYPGIIIGLIIYCTAVFCSSSLIAPDQFGLCNTVVFLLLLLLFIAELYRKSENAILNISVLFAGIIYVTIPFSVLIAVPFVKGAENSFGKILLIAFFILLWVYDIFAYLVGTWLGKHRMFESISPKKSWEGFIGGAIFCVALSVLLSFFYKDLSMVQWIVMALLIIAFGTFGDLVESMFKRSVGVKDSGKFFPGHGGVLDRFDAALLAAPFVYFYLVFFM